MVAMMANPLRLVGGADDEKGAERRMFPRKPVNTRVEGSRVDHTIAALRQPRLSLTLSDVSAGGLCATSSVPLSRGERVNVFFPASGLRSGWDASGHVLRCEPTATGWRIAVEFDLLPAA